MATVRETIVAQVAANMLRLPLGVPAGGESEQIERVEREWQAPEMLPEMPFCFVLDPSEDKAFGGGRGGAILSTYRATLRLLIIVIAKAGRKVRDETQSTTANRILGEVQRKMYAESRPDSGNLRAINGLDFVHDDGSVWAPFGEAAPSLIRVQSNWVIQYRHSDLDPDGPP